jgi:hypothetical protein
MLAWSLWLAVSLLNWLKWGWRCFSSQHLWLPKTEKVKPEFVDLEPVDPDNQADAVTENKQPDQWQL